MAKRDPRRALTVLKPCGNAFSAQKTYMGSILDRKTSNFGWKCPKMAFLAILDQKFLSSKSNPKIWKFTWSPPLKILTHHKNLIIFLLGNSGGFLTSFFETKLNKFSKIFGLPQSTFIAFFGHYFSKYQIIWQNWRLRRHFCFFCTALSDLIRNPLSASRLNVDHPYFGRICVTTAAEGGTLVGPPPFWALPCNSYENTKKVF